MRGRLEHMQRLMSHRPGHKSATLVTPGAAVGITGPGVLPGSLSLHGRWPEPVLIAEGEVYHLNHTREPDEALNGPWSEVRRRWLTQGVSAVGALDGIFTLALVRAPETGAPVEI